MERGFKRKTIEQIIRSNIGRWIRNVGDSNETLAEQIRGDYIVTGGAITSMLLGEMPNDYDVYFRTPSVAAAVARHYTQNLKETDKVSDISVVEEPDRVKIVLKSVGVAFDENDNFSDYQYFEGSDPLNLEEYLNKEIPKKKLYRPACITSNAITLYGGIQLIIRFVGAPEQIHKNYDFVHCTNWFTQKDGLVLNQPALESTLAKELRYVGSLYPLCSMFRIKKFIQRGWTITAGEMLKIAWDISKLNLNDLKVLQEQLVGVDAAYFHQLVNILIQEQKAGRELDRTYVFEIVNRVFDEEDPIAEVTKSLDPIDLDYTTVDYSSEEPYQRNMDEGV